MLLKCIAPGVLREAYEAVDLRVPPKYLLAAALLLDVPERPLASEGVLPLPPTHRAGPPGCVPSPRSRAPRPGTAGTRQGMASVAGLAVDVYTGRGAD